jgi:hypothetical protein
MCAVVEWGAEGWGKGPVDVDWCCWLMGRCILRVEPQASHYPDIPPTYGTLPSLIALLSTSSGTTTPSNSAPNLATIPSLTSLANTLPPTSFKCVRSPAARLNPSAPTCPIFCTYAVDSALTSTTLTPLARATPSVAAVSFARFCTTSPPEKVRRVSGVSRIGVAPAASASRANRSRFVVYTGRETLDAGFWSLWPNWAGQHGMAWQGKRKGKRKEGRRVTEHVPGS